jgi:hypothetical protein
LTTSRFLPPGRRGLGPYDGAGQLTTALEQGSTLGLYASTPSGLADDLRDGFGIE